MNNNDFTVVFRWPLPRSDAVDNVNFRATSKSLTDNVRWLCKRRRLRLTRFPIKRQRINKYALHGNAEINIYGPTHAK